MCGSAPEWVWLFFRTGVAKRADKCGSVTGIYKASGVKRIRVHDIRHSHASLLVEMGFSPLLIAERLGHEKVQTTMDTYSHLYPNKQVEVARQLDGIMP